MHHEMQSRNLDKNPDQVRKLSKGKTDIAFLAGTTVARMLAEPGWQWSKDVKPVVNTNSCQLAHTQYAISGRLRVRMDDGTEQEFGPGDAIYIPPGHDAWVVGNEPFVAVEFTAAEVDPATSKS
jgi:mannose-6-phosphate isomerase-like protein (cupin superfamily)